MVPHSWKLSHPFCYSLDCDLRRPLLRRWAYTVLKPPDGSSEATPFLHQFGIKLHHFTIVYDTFPVLRKNPQSLINTGVAGSFLLPFFQHLEDIELQIIAFLVAGPEYGVIRGLSTEFHLPETPVGCTGSLSDHRSKGFRIHKM